MTALLEGYLWCGLQVTLLTTACGLLYLLLCRRTRLRASLPQSCLAMVLVLSLLAASPWPSWSWFERFLRRDTETQTLSLLTSSELNRDQFIALENRSVLAKKISPAKQPSAVAVATSPRTKAEIRETFVELLKSSAWKSGFLVLVGTSCSLAAVRLLFAWRELNKRVRASRLFAVDRLPTEFAELCRQYGIVRPVALRESLHEEMPATIGWQRPSILLPPSWREWTPAQRRAVLAHELAHIKHHDFATCLAAQLPLLLHSYHPLVHWLARRLRWEQEIAADRRAIEVLGDRAGYMAALAELALKQPTRPRAGDAYALAPTSSMLLRRLQMLRKNRTDKFLSVSPLQRAVLLASLAVVSLGVAGLRQKATAQPGYDTPSANSADPAVNDASVVVTALVLLSAPPAVNDGGDARVFWETQVALIKSPVVLESALMPPAVADSKLLKTKKVPGSWLLGQLEVSRIPNSPVLRIRLKCPASEAAAGIRIVDGITSKYKNLIAGQERFFNNGNEDNRKTVATLHKELSAKLQEKIVKYQTLAAELGGADSKIATTHLNMLIDELSHIRTQIMKNKEELVEIGVNRAIAERQATSTTAMEQAVEEELDKDPMLASFKADEYAFWQQIRALQAANEKVASSQIEELQSSIQQLQQDAINYRVETAAQIRKARKAAPIDFLETVMLEYKIRLEHITAELAKLETEYEEKAGEIEKKGSSSELSMLESEIQQLQEIEREMEHKLRSRSINHRSTESAIQATLLLRATITSNPTILEAPSKHHLP